MTDHPKTSPEIRPSLYAKWRRWWKVGALVLGITAAALFIGGWQLSEAYGARAAKYDLRKLKETSTATMVLDRSGQPLGSLNDNNRGFVPLDEFPPHVIDALIATEDSRFYRHHGVDYVGIARAMVKNLAHLSVKQGGSTVTQQLARQTFSLKGRTFDRKLLETFVARRIENSFSKSEILECYLNRIYLGHGFYGVGAAARGYFGKDVKDLTLHEAALIVGIIKAPVPYSPFRNAEAARRVRDLTLKRMHRLEMIDANTLASAQGLPLGTLEEGARLGRQNYALAAVEEELETLARTGQGGPWKTVSVTVDGALQAKISALVSDHVARIESKLPSADKKEAAAAGKLQAAVVILDNRTGTVLVTCGGRDYVTSPFDRASQGLRPAGTAFL
ncbi:transglycosylase domain-containing protein, partial [Verrucomicrobium sp. BvORR106]|uniref:transglycosylase domain-containing protein n=1 Tax=Verrucomicrobium sp. BvORR106 TaxID=1403819 RepID=UPI002240ED61